MPAARARIMVAAKSFMLAQREKTGVRSAFGVWITGVLRWELRVCLDKKLVELEGSGRADIYTNQFAIGGSVPLPLGLSDVGLVSMRPVFQPEPLVNESLIRSLGDRQAGLHVDMPVSMRPHMSQCSSPGRPPDYSPWRRGQPFFSRTGRHRVRMFHVSESLYQHECPGPAQLVCPWSQVFHPRAGHGELRD